MANIYELWAARDENGELWLYSTKPECYELSKVYETNSYGIELDPKLLPGITWTSGPKEVKLVLKENLDEKVVGSKK
jgi:hypothetical protein